MMDIVCPMPDNIEITPRGRDERVDESARSILTAKIVDLVRWVVRLAPTPYTLPGAAAKGDEWIEKALPLLQRVAELPDNWDSEGSPRTDLGIVSAVTVLLDRLRGRCLGAIPVPFVCPVSGGGVQLEWSSSKKYLELEFLDDSTIVFLKEELTPQPEVTESGQYPLGDAEATRQLLDWFGGV